MTSHTRVCKATPLSSVNVNSPCLNISPYPNFSPCVKYRYVFTHQGVQGYASVLRQRQIVVLGRNINVSKAAIHHIHMCLFRDIDAAIRRFEMGDACGIIPLYNLLDILRKTHGMLTHPIKHHPPTHPPSHQPDKTPTLLTHPINTCRVNIPYQPTLSHPLTPSSHPYLPAFFSP